MNCKKAIKSLLKRVALIEQNGVSSTTVNEILDLIPEQASPQNQLADKEFVNSSISTATADFKGTVNSVNDLDNITANNNDYAFVVDTDSNGNTQYKRYKYNGTSWVFEYYLNNSSFTAAQWDAIQSNITQALVNKLSALPTNPVTSSDINNVVCLTQDEYDALVTKDANTEYNIIESV